MRYFFLINSVFNFFFLASSTCDEQQVANYQNPVNKADRRKRSSFSTDSGIRTTRTTSRSVQSSSTEQEIASLQTWLNNKVKNSNQIVGLSTFIVAGKGTGEGIKTISSGQAVIAKAWDVTKKKGTNNTVKNVSADTTSMLASTSKLFTWTALSMLLDAGKFDLDDPIDNILSFQIRNPSFPNVPITYRHLYAHTSGIEDEYSSYRYGDQCPSNPMFPFSLTESLEVSMKKHVSKNSSWKNVRPGSKYLYSNYATSVAALLVEKHSEMTFPEFTKKFIFDPLQMTSTQWSRPTDGSASELYTLFQNKGYKYKTYAGGYCFPDYPSGQLWSTPNDLAKFSTSMLKRGNLGYTTSDGADCLYSEVTGDLVFQKSSPSTGGGDSGLGWFVGSPYYKEGAGHDGSESGTSADLFVNLEKNVAIGYWANGDLTGDQYVQIYNRLLQTAKAIGAIDNDYDPNNPKECTTTFSTGGSPTPPTPTPPTPTLTPVLSPTVSNDCVDSTLKFKVRVNGRNRFKNCNWVKQNTARCSTNGVSASCPFSCGTCSNCVDSPLIIKVVRRNGSKMNKRCTWANDWRCNNFDGLGDSCRKRCSTCDSSNKD